MCDHFIAVSSSDYSDDSTMIVVTVNATTLNGSVAISIVNDTVLELQENFTVSVVDSVGFPVMVSGEDPLVISILDDEGSSKQ